MGSCVAVPELAYQLHLAAWEFELGPIVALSLPDAGSMGHQGPPAARRYICLHACTSI